MTYDPFAKTRIEAVTCSGCDQVFTPADIPAHTATCPKAVMRSGENGRYRVRSETVQAMCYQGEDSKQAVRYFLDSPIDERQGLSVETVAGWVNVNPGDWIVKDAGGWATVCTDAIFRVTYEAAS